MTERELAKGAAYRLAILRHAEEVTGNVSKTCRYYGISPQTYYKWLKRYEAEGADGLRDRSRRPLTSPTATSLEVVGKVIHLRKNYHFGPQKISMYLKRYHDVELSPSGVWRILKRLNMKPPALLQPICPPHQALEALRETLPGHQVQIDVKFVAPLGGAKKKYYQFTAIDDCTRLRVLRIYERLDQKRAIQFVDYVLEKLPFRVEQIQTDNGGEFQSSFHWHLLDRGIRHLYIKPATPRLNGKVERSHRIDVEEFYQRLEGVVIDDSELFKEKLQEWEDYYSYHRPHGSLGGQTPYERLRQKTEPVSTRSVS